MTGHAQAVCDTSLAATPTTTRPLANASGYPKVFVHVVASGLDNILDHLACQPRPTHRPDYALMLTILIAKRVLMTSRMPLNRLRGFPRTPVMRKPGARRHHQHHQRRRHRQDKKNLKVQAPADQQQSGEHAMQSSGWMQPQAPTKPT